MVKYTLEELKQIARDNNLPTSGTKMQVYERVEHLLVNQQRGCRYSTAMKKCSFYDGPNIDQCFYDDETDKCKLCKDFTCLKPRHTKQELVDLCRQKGLSVSGNKGDLWDRVCSKIDIEPYAKLNKGCKLSDTTGRCGMYAGPDVEPCYFFPDTQRCRKW